MKEKKEEEKCAPSRKYSEGTCFTIDELKSIANSYNKYIKKGKLNSKVKSKYIKITDNKKDLLIQLTDRLENVCNDQICWLKQNFIKDLNNKEITKKTFRPEGPDGRFEWLNTLHINDVMEQYEDKYTDFKFYGAVPIDFHKLPFLGIRDINLDDLYNSGKKKLGFVFNLD